MVELCKGIRTNCTLKQIHLSYCNIDENGGEALSDILENARSALEVVNLNGNKLGGVGLSSLCRGLMVNTKCEKLMLADNCIESVRFITVLFDAVPPNNSKHIDPFIPFMTCRENMTCVAWSCCGIAC